MWLIGMGFDGDGHTRITQGPNTRVEGGSGETHERMQETAIKFEERIRGRDTRDMDPREFMDIARKCAGE